MKEKAVEIIKEVLESKDIKVIKMILFGSRVRDNFREDSDWDFLILIDRELDFHERWKIINQIQRKLAELRIPNDIILKSEEQFNIMKNYVGNISYYASRDGIEV